MATKKNPELEAFRKLVKEMNDLGLRSKAATVQRILPEFERLASSGYTHEKLVEVMNEAGLELSVGTLRSIRNRIKDKSSL